MFFAFLSEKLAKSDARKNCTVGKACHQYDWAIRFWSLQLHFQVMSVEFLVLRLSY